MARWLVYCRVRRTCRDHQLVKMVKMVTHQKKVTMTTILASSRIQFVVSLAVSVSCIGCCMFRHAMDIAYDASSRLRFLNNEVVKVASLLKKYDRHRLTLLHVRVPQCCQLVRFLTTSKTRGVCLKVHLNPWISETQPKCKDLSTTDIAVTSLFVRPVQDSFLTLLTVYSCASHTMFRYS